MDIMHKLIKLAEDLENAGLVDEADEITDAVEKGLPEHNEPIQPPVRTESQPMYFEKETKAPVNNQLSEQAVASVGDELIEGLIYMMAKKGEVSEDDKGLRVDDATFVNELMNLL